MKAVLHSLVIFLSFSIGGVFGYWFSPNASSLAFDDCTQKYYLTSPTVGCDEYEDRAQALKHLNEVLSNQIRSFITLKKADRISVWIRDLNTRQYASVNEFDKYAPASLFKLPLMVAYYKFAEFDPTVLERKIIFKSEGVSENDLEQNKPERPLAPGTAYTFDELIEHMIIDSDNDAARILVENMDQNFFNKVLTEIGLTIPTTEDATVDFVTAKSYANVYRMLYNASYLNRDLSQKALEVLAKTNFRGMKEKLPDSTVVAHKFGERNILYEETGKELHQLHDCGIVYKETRPYSLCIMTEGDGFGNLLEVIQSLSLTVYDSL